MSVTVSQLFEKVRAILDELSVNGVEIPAKDVADIQKKAILFFDSAQKRLFKIGNFYKTIEINNTETPNLIGGKPFDIIDFEGETEYYPNEHGVANVQGYHLQVDGDCTIEIQEKQAGVWTSLVTENPSGLTEFATYKGILTVLSTTNPVRMKLSGTTHFRHTNRALFKYKYAVTKVPDYEPWIEYTLPDDFRMNDYVIELPSDQQYINSATYKMEGFKKFFYAYNFNGVIRITYKPVPTTITSIDDVVEIDDITAEIMVYDCAAMIAPYENIDIINFVESRGMEMKADLTFEGPEPAYILPDLYGDD